MSVDLTRLLDKLVPQPDGEDTLRLRAGVIAAINADGTVDVLISGVSVPGVSVLADTTLAAGMTVQILSARGTLLVLGGSDDVVSQPVEATGTTTLGSTTATVFTNTLTTTGIHGVSFTAPSSGKVQVIGRAAGGSSTVGQYSLLDYELRTGSTIGSGTVVRAGNNNTAGVFLSSTSGGQGTLVTGGNLTGLTPGSTYNVSLTYASSVGTSTATFNRRYVAVKPL